MIKIKHTIARRPHGRQLIRAWNWFWLRICVLSWMFLNGRISGFSGRVKYAKERSKQTLRQDLHELIMEGEVHGEEDENGVMRYYSRE